MGIVDNEQFLKRIKALGYEEGNEAINRCIIYSSQFFPVSEVFFTMPASGTETFLSAFLSKCCSSAFFLNFFRT